MDIWMLRKGGGVGFDLKDNMAAWELKQWLRLDSNW